MAAKQTTTRMLRGVRAGQPGAAAQLLPVVYEELHRVASQLFAGQSASHTLQPTALVHEAYLKLIDQSRADDYDRTHFFRVAAKAMRQVLIDHARSKKAAKRGDGWKRLELETVSAPSDSLTHLDLLALGESLEKLEQIDSRQAEVVQLRFFVGLSVDETAEILQVSPRTVELDWKMAKAWLSRALSEQG